MVKEPLEVEPAKFDSKLDFMSRVSFGKIYTVEHNVNVFPVGKISEASKLRLFYFWTVDAMIRLAGLRRLLIQILNHIRYQNMYGSV
jgi:hypothetical protein